MKDEFMRYKKLFIRGWGCGSSIGVFLGFWKIFREIFILFVGYMNKIGYLFLFLDVVGVIFVIFGELVLN